MVDWTLRWYISNISKLAKDIANEFYNKLQNGGPADEVTITLHAKTVEEQYPNATFITIFKSYKTLWVNDLLWITVTGAGEILLETELILD